GAAGVLSSRAAPAAAIAALSLHDALPISAGAGELPAHDRGVRRGLDEVHVGRRLPAAVRARLGGGPAARAGVRQPGGDPGGRDRSEEHTSELQSRDNLVCRLLLEKKEE